MPDVSRRNFIGASALASTTLVADNEQAAQKVASKQPDRDYWISVLDRLAHPVLYALSQKKLKATMPVEAPHNNVADRCQSVSDDSMSLRDSPR